MNKLAERLLAEEVPNNKVPDGKTFPEWDKAGTPPSQIEESFHVEPIVITIRDVETNTETVIDLNLEDGANRSEVVSTVCQLIKDAASPRMGWLPGVTSVNIGR